MIKILFIHNTIAEYRYRFFEELSKLVDLEIVVTDRSLSAEIYNLKAEIPRNLKVSYIDKIGNLRTIIKGKQFDLVVLPPVEDIYQLKFAMSVTAVCKEMRVKMAYWSERWEADKVLLPMLKKIKNKLHTIAIKYILRKCNVCIVSGKKSYQYIKGIFPEKLIKVAIDSSTSPKCQTSFDLKEKYGISDNSKVILFLARLIKQKGGHILVETFRQLISNDQSLYLLICGEGEELETLKDQVQKNKIDHVIFAGKIEPHVRAEYFSQADVFVLPSYTYKGYVEAWGLTVNESLEQGTPVVVTTAVGAGYDLSDDKSCVMVKENAAASLYIGINKILSEGDVSNLCHERYKQFSVKQMAKQFYEAFKQTINN